MTAGSAASRRVLARTPVAPLPASSPKRPTGITGRMSAPPETSSPEVCSFRLPQMCGFRLPLTTVSSAPAPVDGVASTSLPSSDRLTTAVSDTSPEPTDGRPDSPPPSATATSSVVAAAEICSQLDTRAADGTPLAEWRCQPVGDGATPGRFFFYTRIRSRTSTTVEHQWLRDGSSSSRSLSTSEPTTGRDIGPTAAKPSRPLGAARGGSSSASANRSSTFRSLSCPDLSAIVRWFRQSRKRGPAVRCRRHRSSRPPLRMRVELLKGTRASPRRAVQVPDPWCRLPS